MKELKTLTIILQSPTKEHIPQSLGSVLHGVLMEHLPSAVAAELHKDSINPYSQYIYYDKEKKELTWKISSLTEFAANTILGTAENLPPTIHLKKRDSYLTILDKTYSKESSYEELGDSFLGSEKDYYRISYQFLTSVAFKTNGRYAVFPESRMIIQNLLKKWNTFSSKEVLKEHNLVDTMNDYMYIAAYQLNLHPFALEGTRINAVRGNYTLGFKHNIMIKRIMAMLSAYAEFSGIGIKTALGMGGVNTTFIERKS